MLYHARLAEWVLRLDPTASESLVLAAHCQHLRRWALPRERYPKTRAGYKRWRTALARMHADEAAVILAGTGFGEAEVARVRVLLLKEGLKSDAEVQLFEDAICLTFMELELAAFADKHDDDKLGGVLKKTWNKMSPRGHAAASALAERLPPRVATLLHRAVAEDGD